MLRPRTAFYCLACCPSGTDGEGFTKKLLEEARVLTIPGSDFDPGGDGYVRLTHGVCRNRPDPRGSTTHHGPLLVTPGPTWQKADFPQCPRFRQLVGDRIGVEAPARIRV
ncbi:hypothetical protein AQI88_41180 [Streptomyces cellostaticus]|uniref:Uncharacterized protein n=1 Tax=Streptomyces cellostaticus TaxID=67285 RepID=A0A101N518_9ACTN|nr:hypothetical protein [Streptomyces cellostaticus]KUM86653.1 hypothetical protein AQI88_41180 [Streptomyces cellostaticus]GHI09478.1 hypothetical protein Scel_77990 [Streptomyces cellostaticus]